MNPDRPHKHGKNDDKYLSLIEFDSSEELVCMIRKHPIGLYLIYLSGIFVAATVALFSIVGGAWLQTALSDAGKTAPIGLVISLVGLLVALVVIFFTYVSGFIYQHNVIMITTDKIAQVLYTNLIDRKISQLSIGEIQDVTVNQSGILARLFNYGTLVIETAGEQNNYNFTYTPYPYNCSKEIVSAHEMSIKKYGN